MMKTKTKLKRKNSWKTKTKKQIKTKITLPVAQPCYLNLYENCTVTIFLLCRTRESTVERSYHRSSATAEENSSEGSRRTADYGDRWPQGQEYRRPAL